ncbi:MAG: type II toxin-antitoxin system Phd/YefM family antitoxin [Anaerolineae bacterium]
MNITTVGKRELKNKLSKYLQQVKEGQTVIITERGKAIGQILPIGVSLPERMRALQAAGFLEWSGRKLSPRRPRIINRGAQSVEEIISEGRNVDSLP